MYTCPVSPRDPLPPCHAARKPLPDDRQIPAPSLRFPSLLSHQPNLHLLFVNYSFKYFLLVTENAPRFPRSSTQQILGVSGRPRHVTSLDLTAALIWNTQQTYLPSTVHAGMPEAPLLRLAMTACHELPCFYGICKLFYSSRCISV